MKDKTTKQKKKKTFHVKVYILEEYWKEAESREEALEKVNLDGDPTLITTLKRVVKVVK